MGISLEKIFQISALKATISRFPVSAACAILLFIYIFLITHGLGIADLVGFRIILILAGGYFWFGATKLFKEAGGRLPRKFRGLDILIFLVYVVYIFFTNYLSFSLIFPAMVLSIAVAPYLMNRDSLSFWFFNQRVWQGAGISIATAGLLALGVCAVLGSIRYLFQIHIPGQFYADGALFAFAVLAPLYSLAWVPNTFYYTEQDCKAPRQLSFAMNWVLAPLVIVYLLILYAYFAKIVITQEVPRNMLAYMIMGFGGAGIVAYLSGYPLYREGVIATRFFYRMFFPTLLIPACVMFYAIAERILQYGVTEARYGVVMVAFWFALCSLVFSWAQFTRNHMPLKFIVLSAMMLMLVSAVGPWSAENVSTYSQRSRLEKLLNANGILQNNVIGKAPKEVSFGHQKQISAIVNYFAQKNKINALKEWFPPELKGGAVDKNGLPLFNRSKVREIQPQDLIRMMGFEYVSRYDKTAPVPPGQRFSFHSSYRKKPLEIAGFDYYLTSHSVSMNNNTNWVYHADGTRPRMNVNLIGQIMNVKIGDAKPVLIDLKNAIEKAKLVERALEDRDYMTLEGENEAARIRLHIISFNGLINGDVPTFRDLDFILLVKDKNR